MLPPLPQICALLIVCALYIGTFFTYNHPMTKKLINSKRASNNTKPQHDESLELFVNESLENSAERHWVLAERRRHVTQFCQRRLAQGGWPYLERDFTERNLVFVEKFNLSYCPIGKTGTSTWFARFSNSSERQDEHIRRRWGDIV